MPHVSETAWEAGTQLPGAARWPPFPGHGLHCSLRTGAGGGECAVTAPPCQSHSKLWPQIFQRRVTISSGRNESRRHHHSFVLFFPDFPLALQINPQITYWRNLDFANSIQLHDLFLKWFPQLKESLKESVFPVLHRHRKIAITIIIRCIFGTKDINFLENKNKHWGAFKKMFVLSLQVEHQCCKSVCKECVANGHNPLEQLLENSIVN